MSEMTIFCPDCKRSMDTTCRVIEKCDRCKDKDRMAFLEAENKGLRNCALFLLENEHAACEDEFTKADCHSTMLAKRDALCQQFGITL